MEITGEGREEIEQMIEDIVSLSLQYGKKDTVFNALSAAIGILISSLDKEEIKPTYTHCIETIKKHLINAVKLSKHIKKPSEKTPEGSSKEQT